VCCANNVYSLFVSMSLCVSVSLCLCLLSLSFRLSLSLSLCLCLSLSTGNLSLGNTDDHVHTVTTISFRLPADARVSWDLLGRVLSFRCISSFAYGNVSSVDQHQPNRQTDTEPRVYKPSWFAWSALIGVLGVCKAEAHGYPHSILISIIDTDWWCWSVWGQTYRYEYHIGL